TVGRFGNDLRANAPGVLGGDLVFQRRRHKYVALHFEHLAGRGHLAGTGEVQNGTCRPQMLKDGFDIESCRVVNAAFLLGDGDDSGVAFPLQELGRMITDIAESLDDDALAGDAGTQPEWSHVVGVRQTLADAIKNTEPGRFLAAGNAVERERLAGDAGV